MRPGYPSEVRYVAGRGDLVGVAARCAHCGEVSLNLVSRAHLDVPFFHDRVVHYLERPFGDSRDLTLEEFRGRLNSARFDSARADLSDAA